MDKIPAENHINSEPGRLSQSIKWLSQTGLGITVISLILSLLALVVLILIFGANPIDVLSALIKGSFRGKAAVTSTLEEMAVLILCGLSILIPIKGGYFNIAVQGQLEIGAFTAVVVATTCPGPAIIVIPLSLLAGMAAGILIGLIPLTLRVKRGASEVTTGIMLNFVCTYFVYAMIYGPFMEKGAYYATTVPVPVANRLPDIFGVHCGVFLAIIFCGLAYVLTNRTTFGTRLYATGYNRRAALAAGIPVKRIMNTGVLLGAAIAGLAGSVEAMGVTFRVAQGWASNWGFTGVCIAFLGGNAIGVVPIAFLLSIIGVGGRYMQSMTGVPAALVDVISGMPVVIFLIFSAVKLSSVKVNIKEVWGKKKNKDDGVHKGGVQEVKEI